MSMSAAAVYVSWPSPSLPKLQGDDSPIGSPITEVNNLLNKPMN